MKRHWQGDVFRPLTFCKSMPSPGEVGHLSHDVLLVGGVTLSSLVARGLGGVDAWPGLDGQISHGVTSPRHWQRAHRQRALLRP